MLFSKAQMSYLYIIIPKYTFQALEFEIKYSFIKSIPSWTFCWNLNNHEKSIAKVNEKSRNSYNNNFLDL